MLKWGCDKGIGYKWEPRDMPFGDVRTDMDTAGETDFGYAGQREIEGSELMDYNARFMNPGLTRFTQQDTIIPNPANPQTSNMYLYVNYNSIKYTDPTGHRICEDVDVDTCNISEEDVKVILTELYTEKLFDEYDWKVKRKWTLKELKTMYQTGRDIEAYIDSLTGGKGREWMNEYMGNVAISRTSKSRSSAFPGVLGFWDTIYLTNNWLNFDPKKWLAHELAHIIDINTADAIAGIGAKGGAADWLNGAIGGNIGFFECR